MYHCKICNYNTPDKCNYQKHTNTKKHKDKIQELTDLLAEYQNPIQTIEENVFKCPYCNNHYANSGNLSRHKTLCAEKQQLIDKINNQAELLKQKEETIVILTDEVKYLQLLLENAGSLIKTSVHAISYAMAHYKNAPVLETLKDCSVLKYNQTDTDFIENLVVEYKNKLLPSYLGDFIIKTYKKDDPTQQSIWNSDTNRLTYIVKELINTTNTDWQVDKKGIKITKYIIEPMLTYIENLIRSYIENFDTHTNLYKPKEAEYKMMKLKYATDIIKIIEDRVLHDDILKYISSHFYMNKIKMVR